jgi:hypothetical protein
LSSSVESIPRAEVEEWLRRERNPKLVSFTITERGEQETKMSFPSFASLPEKLSPAKEKQSSSSVSLRYIPPPLPVEGEQEEEEKLDWMIERWTFSDGDRERDPPSVDLDEGMVEKEDWLKERVERAEREEEGRWIKAEFAEEEREKKEEEEIRIEEILEGS